MADTPKAAKTDRRGRKHGGGMPKGHQTAKTVAKEQAREELRRQLTAELRPVAEALVGRAKGIRYFITRNKKTGKFELVTDPKRVVAALNAEDDESGEFYTDKPDVAAIREILDRTCDKAQEPEQTLTVKGSVEVVTARLLAARKRLARPRS